MFNILQEVIMEKNMKIVYIYFEYIIMYIQYRLNILECVYIECTFFFFFLEKVLSSSSPLVKGEEI